MGWVANDRRQSLYPRERAPVSILHEPGGVSVLVSIGTENISAAGFRKLNPPARSESKPKTCCLKVERERICHAWYFTQKVLFISPFEFLRATIWANEESLGKGRWDGNDSVSSRSKSHPNKLPLTCTKAFQS